MNAGTGDHRRSLTGHQRSSVKVRYQGVKWARSLARALRRSAVRSPPSFRSRLRSWMLRCSSTK